MIEYRINKDKGVVCAFMTNCNRDFVNFVYNCTAVHRNGDCNFVADLIDKKLLEEFPDKFFAVAKCNPETNDTWNEEFGKEVAKAKLLAKYYRVRARFIGEIFSDISMMMNDFRTGILSRLNEGFSVATEKMTINNEIVYAVNMGYDPTDPDSDISQYLDAQDWNDLEAADIEIDEDNGTEEAPSEDNN